MAIDDLFRQIEEDELADKIEATTHATPIEYARSRGMAPQKVYYALRNHPDRIRTEPCMCGRKVIDITAADIYFGVTDARDANEVRGDEDEATEVAIDGTEAAEA